MFKIVGNDITLTRGDSFYTDVEIKNEDKSTYTPQAGDSVKFFMKKRYKDQDTLIEKTVPTDSLILHLEPEDTEELDFGRYVYNVKLFKENGDVITFVPDDPEVEASFVLGKEA